MTNLRSTSGTISTAERVVLAGLVVAWIISLRQARGLADLATLDASSGSIVAGIALAVAGMATFVLGGRARVGAAALVTGIVMIASADPAPASAIVIGAGVAALDVLEGLLVLVLVVSVLRTRSGSTPHPHRLALAGLAGLTVALAAAVAATYDPLYVLSCVPSCPHVPPLVDPGAGGRITLDTARSVLAIATGMALIAVGSRVVRERGAAPDRVLVGIGSTMVGVASLGEAGLALVHPTGSSLRAEEGVGRVLILVDPIMALGLLVVALGIGLLAVRTARIRSRVRQLADEIGAAPPPGTLGAALAVALNDASVEIAYWLPDSTRYVDADGWPLDEHADTDQRAITTLERHGDPVAVVAHRSSLDPWILTGELRPSLLLALDNERLRAARLVRLRELRASRARIVAVADAERRRVERDLHDGVQQQLLVIAIDLRLARTAAERSDSMLVAQGLASAEAVALAAVEELRRIARGIYPAVLGQAGLVAAFRALGDESPVDIELPWGDVPRLPEALEGAAYQVASELAGVTDVGDHLLLRVGVQQRHLDLELRTPHVVSSGTLQRVEDRVGAVGGSTVAEPLPTGGTLLRVELPCA